MNKSERSMTTKILGVFVLGFALSSFASDSASAQESEFVGTWDLEVSLFPFPTSVPVTFTVNRPLPTSFSFSGFYWDVSWEVTNSIPTKFSGGIAPNYASGRYGFAFEGELIRNPSGYTVDGVWTAVRYYSFGAPLQVFGRFRGSVTP